jgi:hypothetical protein
VQELERRAIRCDNVRPRFAYLAPFQRQVKTVAWDYLRAAMAPLRAERATVHESSCAWTIRRAGRCGSTARRARRSPARRSFIA